MPFFPGRTQPIPSAGMDIDRSSRPTAAGVPGEADHDGAASGPSPDASDTTAPPPHPSTVPVGTFAFAAAPSTASPLPPQAALIAAAVQTATVLHAFIAAAQPITPSPAATSPGTISTSQLSQLLSGLQTSLAAIESSLEAALGQSLPIIGSDLGSQNAAVQTFKNFQTDVDNALQNLVNQGSAISRAALQTALTNAVTAAGFSGAPVVAPDDGSGTVTVSFGETGTLHLPTLSLDSSLGLPGLNFQTHGTAATELDYGVTLSTSVTSAGTFSVGTDTPTLAVHVTAPSFSGNADLGFLQFAATDAGSALDGTFSLASATPTFSGSAAVNVNLQTTTSNAALPSLGANLQVGWSFSNAAVGGAESGFGSQPSVALNNLTLDFGSFVDKFLAPILSNLDTVIAPILPVLDIFNADLSFFKAIPGFDWHAIDTAGALDLAGNSTGDGKVTLLDFLNESGSDNTPALVKTIEILTKIQVA